MTNLTDEQKALLTLHLVSGLGPKLTAAMLEVFGTATNILNASASALAQVPLVGNKTADKFRKAMDAMDIEAEVERMQRAGVTAIFLDDDAYPKALAEIPDPPRVLYIRGTLIEADRRAIGIVGSRSCTAYGKRMAERLAADLARAGWTIVSGLARGIDGMAHKGALDAGGRTLAILAGGLGSIYPPEHKDLAKAVTEQGALLSEVHMQMQPMREMFPARNRIISGLSQAVILIEANAKSGALITARHAGEQGREVFALPGAVDSSASEGTLQLIRDGARLIRHADDVLEDLKGIAPVALPEGTSARSFINPQEPPPGLDELQLAIWKLLDDGPRHQDQLVQELGIDVATMSTRLMMMEMQKAVRRLPGNRFERY